MVTGPVSAHVRVKQAIAGTYGSDLHQLVLMVRPCPMLLPLGHHHLPFPYFVKIVDLNSIKLTILKQTIPWHLAP